MPSPVVPRRVLAAVFALTTLGLSAHLGFHDRDMRFVVEPGAFRVWVGTSSEGGLEGTFTVAD